ncbi:MAG: hypothetical protein QGG53_16675 [Planctomycetota bacterium]|jgi:hypothetical protein|nr:hypothetical protein [Planctomycetota bacterium]
MVKNVLLLVLSIGTIAAMAFILGWYFRKLTRIEEEHWKQAAGHVTPRWARFLTGKGRAKPADTDDRESG